MRRGRERWMDKTIIQYQFLDQGQKIAKITMRKSGTKYIYDLMFFC